MKNRSGRLGLISVAAALALAAGVFIVTQASAVSGTLGVSNANLATGATGSVTVTANVASAPGLGAWTVDVIVANPSQVSIVSCSAPSNSVCNAQYAPGKVRFAGAVVQGLVGSTSLGTVTVKCANTPGSSALNLDTVGFADATVGGPVEIAATFSPGMVTCAAPATATALPTLVPSGTGPASDSGYGWLIAGLALASVAGLAGYGALRVRTRR